MSNAALIALAALLAATPAVAAVVRVGQPVMGTVLEVTVVAGDEASAQRLAEAAVAEARRWDDILTTWREDGELARFNARAGHGAVTVSRDLAGTLRAMLRLAEATSGAFDPGVGPLVRMWREPEQTTTAALEATMSPYRIISVLHLTGQRAELATGATLDAGGIGKGIALDAIADQLRANGAKAAFLDFGGSSQLAIGAPPGVPEGWKVLVTGLAPGSVHGTVALRDASLATARALGAGADAGPIVDPRTGLPVPPPRLATVLSSDATSADAWSTALVVTGPEGLPAATGGGVEALVENASGRSQTAAFPLEAWPERTSH